MIRLYLAIRRYLSVFLVCASTLAMAQQRLVTGKVTSSDDNSGIPGANVLEKGTSNGTVTDVNGTFRISVGDNATLVFSFVGLTTQEVAVGSQSAVNVSLAPDIKTLSEIVVTGYASQEKKDITGSVGVVKAKDLMAFPAQNAETLLQGRVAGVQVTTNGDPNGLPSVRIRGLSSFGNNSPLYVIDGVPTYSIAFLSPNDIESMNVLKDAGAASIYGSRANNGVIIITTKKGKSGKVTVSYDGTYGVSLPGKGLESQLLNPQEQANLEWLTNNNDGLPHASPNYGNGATPILPDYLTPVGAKEGDASVNPALYNTNYGKGSIYQITRANKSGTNWWDATHQNAVIQTHNLNLSGGTDNSRYLIGFNFFNQEGTLKGTGTKRYTVRANTEFKIKDIIRVGENLSMSFTDRQPLWDGGVNNWMQTLQSIIPQYDIGGGYAGTRGSNLGNPHSILGRIDRDKANFNNENRIFGNVYAEVDFMKNLTFRTSFGGSITNGYTNQFLPHYYEDSENNGTNSLTETAYYTNDWIWSNTLTYKKKIGDHNILAVGGMESVKENIGRTLFGSRTDYYTDDPDFRTLTQGAASSQNGSTYNTPSTLLSYFGRVDYGFKDKYFLSGTVRRDGSSKFINQYGVFPSVTAAWRLSQESFLQGSTVFSDLKLRVGFGSMGGQTNVFPQNQFNIYAGRPSDAYYDLSGSSTSSVQGLWLQRIGNPAAKWETKKTVNVGLDASFFGGKLDVTIDAYDQTTEDLLFQLDLPSAAGSGIRPFKNVAKVSNKGIDLQIINKGNISTDLKYEVNFTFTTYKNNIESLAPGLTFFDVDAASTEGRIGARYIRNAAGHPISSFYGYQVAGLFQSASEVSSAPSQVGSGVGRFRFADTNGDGKITPDDRTFLGSPIPSYSYGLNLGLTYKGFDLTVFLYGVAGNQIVNYRKWWTDFPTSFQGRKSTDALYNSWTPTNTGATTPIATTISNISTNQGANSYYVQDGGYLRAKNIQLGYNFPNAVARKVGLESIRLYVQATNLFTVTKYKGLDPEIGNTPSVNNTTRSVSSNDQGYGVDGGSAYGTPKQVIVGLNLKF